jgi:hypothetical protein
MNSDEATPGRVWVNAATLATRELTLGTYSAVNSCISSSRILLEVLQRRGISGRVMPVSAGAFNETAARLVLDGVPMQEWPDEAWSVGIGAIAEVGPQGGWDGHLVVIARSSAEHDLGAPRVLLDPTADQMDRPERGIIVGGPVTFSIEADQAFTPKDPLGTMRGVAGVDLTMVRYWPLPPGSPNAKKYLDTGAWVVNGVDEAAGLVERRVAERLASSPSQAPV